MSNLKENITGISNKTTVSPKDNLIQTIKDMLQVYLKVCDDSPKEEDIMINEFLDHMKFIKKIDVDTLDEKDKTLFVLLDRYVDVITSVRVIFSPLSENVKAATIDQYLTKEVDFERDWSYTVFDMLLGKEINILDNKLGLDREDFVGMGCLVLTKYKKEKGEIDWQQQLVDFIDDGLHASPLLITLIKIRDNNNLS